MRNKMKRIMWYRKGNFLCANLFQKKQRSYTVKGDYFAKLGILSKVDEEEDDEDENGEYTRKNTIRHKASTALSKFGSNPGSVGESNKDSDTLSENVLSSDDEQTPRKKNNGEIKPEKKRIKSKDEVNRFIKVLTGFFRRFY